MKSRLQVLYLVYWGAAEPLGQSLVLPAVKRLAGLGVDLSLVTFEKSQHLEQDDLIKGIRNSLDDHGIRWMPLRYHKRPKVPSTLFDLVQGCTRSIATRLRSSPDIVHARTFIGGLMGLVLAPLLGARLIYHNEGFYPDEQVDAGVWKAGSRQHVLARYLENTMYTRADGIIALSHLAKRQIESIPLVERRATPVTVVPSCVELGRFPPPPNSIACDGSLRFIYVGSVGGRYELDKIGRFVAEASRRFSRVNLRVLTMSDRYIVTSTLSAAGLSSDCWSMDSVPHEAVPAEMARRHVGMHFLPQGLSDHGGSPTKVGEYWAAGLPVVVTRNAGDTTDIITSERVGVVVNEHNETEYGRVMKDLRSLLSENGLARRCRRAAESHYALGPACERQLSLYYDLVSARTQSTTLANLPELSTSKPRPNERRGEVHAGTAES
ncbi:MAG TPA: glycosyltransferase [Blastocatellia bacterium]|nr:glycosyltransferase [Blastocatellia bacterium]